MVSAEKSRSKLKKYDVLAVVSLFYKFSWRVFDFSQWQHGIALTEQNKDLIQISLRSFLVIPILLYIPRAREIVACPAFLLMVSFRAIPSLPAVISVFWCFSHACAIVAL